ncbi:hypothetical protein B0T16DRAFT_175417 [Cercophora newfieldiana]|uniref:Uncharacterized protein n=1 Tax=Cercophora newfieldiana TaxID=92897 RepID=A0AA39XZ99_9PEZI|nr:hypothetical protein B0T16DRAFT_175417 [Cercophora newfieldiana]
MVSSWVGKIDEGLGKPGRSDFGRECHISSTSLVKGVLLKIRWRALSLNLHPSSCSCCTQGLLHTVTYFEASVFEILSLGGGFGVCAGWIRSVGALPPWCALCVLRPCSLTIRLPGRAMVGGFSTSSSASLRSPRMTLKNAPSPIKKGRKVAQFRVPCGITCGLAAPRTACASCTSVTIASSQDPQMQPAPFLERSGGRFHSGAFGPRATDQYRSAGVTRSGCKCRACLSDAPRRHPSRFLSRDTDECSLSRPLDALFWSSLPRYSGDRNECP